MNTLYYGDNLKILRDYIKDETVDLIYLDPPFNSNRNYNVLFRGRIGQRQRIADHGVRRHVALEPRRRASLQRADKRTRSGRADDRELSPTSRHQPDDGLSRHDGRPPKGTPPRASCRPARSISIATRTLRIIWSFVAKAREMVYSCSRYKVYYLNYPRLYATFYVMRFGIIISYAASFCDEILCVGDLR